MRRLVSLATAAHILGIDRCKLQERIKRGEIVTFEGKIELAVLENIYPTLLLQGDGMVERLQLLKDTAFSRRIREVVEAPSQEDQVHQLQCLTAELEVERARCRKYLDIIQLLAQELADLHEQCNNPMQREIYSELKNGILQRMQG
ncbi:conserved hypothetical protein [Gammaproteobacteria bacterium]